MREDWPCGKLPPALQCLADSFLALVEEEPERTPTASMLARTMRQTIGSDRVVSYSWNGEMGRLRQILLEEHGFIMGPNSRYSKKLPEKRGILSPS